MFDVISDSMRGRHKMELLDRSYHPDASREGETLQQFFEDRQRPVGQRHWGDYTE